MTLSDEQLAQAKDISVEQVRLLRRSRGATNETLDGLPVTAVRRALRRLDYPDLPNARVLFRYEQERGDDGTVPPHAQGTARARMRSLVRSTSRPPRRPVCRSGTTAARGRTGRRRRRG
ncbi:hypothetical protein O1L60_33285 [Streptomyces diastatochromogenes]|nr:hypothetical protein [Streptomyces diastatochromogenes]